MKGSNETTYQGHDERVILFLPRSRDAASIPLVLAEVGITSIPCATKGDVCAEIGRGAGALIIAEEMISPQLFSCLQDTLESAPTWSELPVLLLLQHGPEAVLEQYTAWRGDVTLVERPIRVKTFVAHVRSALRGRRRQYLVRDQMLELERSESRYRTLFNSIDEGFCIVEVIFDEKDRPLDYLFLETNPSFKEQTGLVNVQGKRIRELAPGHEEHWFETYGKVALTGQPVRFQNWAAQPHRWYDVYAFRYGDPKDRQVAILFKDLTYRKLAEQEIERLNEDLATQVADLREANVELEGFNRMVSHDLRQPLNNMALSIQAVELLCGEKLDEECTGHIHSVHRKITAMNDLITALLNFSRSTHGELRRETVDLSELARGVAAELRVGAPDRQVTFKISDGLQTEGDASLMRVVLENLIGNAWKYSADRVPAVIEFGATRIDGEEVFFVQDNGMGFDMADAGDVFAPFKRLPGADQFKGFGIGLATVERIIRRHGGRVWAQSERGKGATFYFCLGTGNEAASS